MRTNRNTAAKMMGSRGKRGALSPTGNPSRGGVLFYFENPRQGVKKNMGVIRDLRPGERGRVVGFESGDREYRRRLLAMGLTPGVEFQLARVAPLGDPVEIRVRGGAVSLRKAEADMLKIERCDDGHEH